MRVSRCSRTVTDWIESRRVETQRIETQRIEGERALVELAELPYLLDRPFVAPPGLPRERAQALQQAFRAVQRDPQYLDEAARLKLDLSPIGGDEVVRAIGRIGAASPDTLDYMKKLLTNKAGE
jgi:hypothetical protein